MNFLVFFILLFINMMNSAKLLGNETIDTSKIEVSTNQKIKFEVEGREIFDKLKDVSSIELKKVEDLTKIGDVVLSYFKESIFTSLRCGDWVLLDGRSLDVNSDLYALKGWSNVPDLRDRYFWQDSSSLGQFTSQKTSAPSSGLTVSTAAADTHNHALNGGGYFSATSASHSHTYNHRGRLGNVGGWAWPNVCWDMTSDSGTASGSSGQHTHSLPSVTSYFSRTHGHTVNSPWSTYTRPDSMKINAYIKIND